MARKARGLALLVTLALAGCPNFSFSLPFSIPFLSGKSEEREAEAAQAKLAELRARTDSLRKARKLADSLAQVRQAACVDSVRIDLTKAAAAAKGKKKKKKKATPVMTDEAILAKAGTVCNEMALPQTTIATDGPASAPADNAKPGAHDSATKAQPAVRQPEAAPAAPEPAAQAATPQLPSGPPAPAVAMTPASDSLTPADSVRKAKEIELSRETFSYGGAARDPFNSLLNMAKSGPELADLQLVGIYQNLRNSDGNVAVFREKKDGKRYKLRMGDQVGRSRLVQIRERDVVFMIEDFGFERQETLSLRKQEDVIP